MFLHILKLMQLKFFTRQRVKTSKEKMNENLLTNV